MGLFIVKATMGREDQVMDFIVSNAKKTPDVHSVLHPQGLRGYILVEADDAAAVRDLVKGVPYARGVLVSETNYEQIQGMIEFNPEEIEINIGDVVRVIAGPFKGEKAKVKRVDIPKAQVVLELLEAAVPIPITIGLESVKVIDRKEEKKE